MRNHKQGFTLIELLVVISIIALLSTAGLIALRTAQRTGRDTKRIADLRAVQSALELYFTRYGTYPLVQSWTELETELQQVGVSRLPRDPIYKDVESGYDYGYQNLVGGSANDYVLKARLELDDNPALANDIDGGNVGGVDCGVGSPEDPPNYCVTP